MLTPDSNDNNLNNNGMDGSFKERFETFIIGALAGGIPGGIKLFSVAPIQANLVSLIGEYLARLGGTLLIAFFAGFLSLFIKDMYEGLFQQRFKNWYKKFNNKKTKDDEQRKERDAA